MKRDETMGDLVSKGRTVYPDTESEFDGAVVIGQTYPVSANEFLFVSAVFPGDLAKIERTRAQAEKTHSFAPDTHTFSPRE